jgi:hypothetical protein
MNQEGQVRSGRLFYDRYEDYLLSYRMNSNELLPPALHVRCGPRSTTLPLTPRLIRK